MSSVQFSSSVVSDSATPWIAARQASLCITTPRIHSNSCPSSRWCHPTISSSVASSYLHAFPASGSFPMSQCFAWGDQSIGASVSVLPMNIHLNWFNSDDKFGGLFCFRTKDKNICKMSLFLFYKLPLFLTYSINKFNWISVMSKY